MKKILLTSAIAVMATFASNAAVSPYVSLRIGYTDPNLYLSDKDNDYLAGELVSDRFAFDASGAIGVKFGLSQSFALRGEIEYDYVEGFKFASTQYWERSHTVLANAYIDFKTMSGFTPYVSAGAGYQFNHVSTKISNSDPNTTPGMFAWQVGGGVTYNMTNALSVDLGYRRITSSFYKLKHNKWGTGIKNIYNQVRLGVSYAF